MTETRKLKGRVLEETLSEILRSKALQVARGKNEVSYWTGKNLFAAVRNSVRYWDIFIVRGERA